VVSTEDVEVVVRDEVGWVGRGEDQDFGRWASGADCRVVRYCRPRRRGAERRLLGGFEMEARATQLWR